MRKLFIILLFIFAITPRSKAQELIDFTPEWLDSNLFHNMHVSILGDWFNTPAVYGMDAAGNYANPRTSFGIGLASIGYEPRLNLYNYNDRISVSVSAPVTLSFSAIDGLWGGVGSVHLPLIAEGNFFGQSTSYSGDRIGFSVGGGVCYTYAPFAVLDPYPGIIRAWSTYVGRLQYKYERYDGAFRSVSVIAGSGKPIHLGIDPYTGRSKVLLPKFCLLVTVSQRMDW